LNLAQIFNPETAVRSTHQAQPIDSLGISGGNLITNKVAAIFPDTPDKPIDCTMHALPSAVYRVNELWILSLKILVHKGIFLGRAELIDKVNQEKILCGPKIKRECL
jgi:hypothetical protein